MVAKPNELKVLMSEPTDSGNLTFSMLLWFPAGSNHEVGKHFKVPDGGHCRITWTTASTCATYRGTGTPSMDHFSTLPYGWLPNDGADFIGQFLESLVHRWRRLCEQGKDHLGTCVSLSYYHQYSWRNNIKSNCITAFGSITSQRKKPGNHSAARARCTNMVRFPKDAHNTNAYC